VTGPTGSGKSTTLCGLIDLINRERTDHIVTIEDPIEFVHENKRCLITQRQVHLHTESFKTALRAALREDPDIVLVGEMRDLETIAIAIETAETGHLVFGTLHTTTAASTVDRIIDQFPADRQAQIRMMLSESLRGVISQTLCRKIGGGRVAAREVLLATPAIANLIREGKTFQIPSIIQTSRKLGMITLNDALLDLVERKLIEPDEAYVRSIEKTAMLQSLKVKGYRTTVAPLLGGVGDGEPAARDAAQGAAGGHQRVARPRQAHREIREKRDPGDRRHRRRPRQQRPRRVGGQGHRHHAGEARVHRPRTGVDRRHLNRRGDGDRRERVARLHQEREPVASSASAPAAADSLDVWRVRQRAAGHQHGDTETQPDSQPHEVPPACGPQPTGPGHTAAGDASQSKAFDKRAGSALPSAGATG
jgi:hypothetical protein